MKKEFVINTAAILLILSCVRATSAAMESVSSDDLSQSIVLELDPVLADDADSEPLSPRDYYPLGMGIRKNSKKSLVPFCVAKHRLEKNCTYIQYFEVELGNYRDSDRSVNETYGAPEGRIASQSQEFHGLAIGKPITGYLYSGGGIDQSIEGYLGSFEMPTRLTHGQAVDEIPFFSGFGERPGSPKSVTVSLALGFLGAVAVSQSASNLSDNVWTSISPQGIIWTTAAVSAAIPQIFIVSKVLKSRSRIRKFKRMQLARRQWIQDAFAESKRIGENWTLISVKVPVKAYDTFVDFLKSRAL